MSAPQLASRSPWAELWTLDPDVAVPEPRLVRRLPARGARAARRELRLASSASRSTSWRATWSRRLADARADVAAFLGAQVPTTSRSSATRPAASTRCCARSTSQPGDELLTTDHATAPAARRRWITSRPRTGARVVMATVPVPDRLAEDDVRRPRAGGRHAAHAAGAPRPRDEPDRARLPDRAPGGRALRERGVDTLVDGAHAPGMVPLDLDALGAAYYTGNAHKWLCAPKGSRLPARAPRPPGAASTRWSSATATTRSRTAAASARSSTGPAPTTRPAGCACPSASATWAALLPGGWPEMQARNHALALRARDRCAQALDAATAVPGRADRVARLRPAAGGPRGRRPRRRSTSSGSRTWYRERGVETWFHPLAGGRLLMPRLRAALQRRGPVRPAGRAAARGTPWRLSRTASSRACRRFDTAMVVVSLVIGIGIFRTPAIVAPPPAATRASSGSGCLAAS